MQQHNSKTVQRRLAVKLGFEPSRPQPLNMLNIKRREGTMFNLTELRTKLHDCQNMKSQEKIPEKAIGKPPLASPDKIKKSPTFRKISPRGAKSGQIKVDDLFKIMNKNIKQNYLDKVEQIKKSVSVLEEEESI